MDATKEQFEAGVKVVQSLAKNGGTFQPSTNMMLTFYSLYKQATQGECHTSRPSFYDPIGRAKWDAWKQLGNMPAKVAMREYVDELKKIVEAMPQTEVVQDFVEKLGNFYEMVDENEAATSVTGTKDVRFVGQSLNDLLPECVTNERQLLNRTNCNTRHNGFIPGDQAKTTQKSSKNRLEANASVDNVKDESSEESKHLDECRSIDEIPAGMEDDGTDANDDHNVENVEEINAGMKLRIFSRSSQGSGETFDDDEFCDTTDILINQEESTNFHSLTSSGMLDGPRNSEVTFCSTLVQTEDHLPPTSDSEVLQKVNRAIEEMHKDLIELKEEVKNLDGVHRAKVQMMTIFDFLHKYNVPKMCFYIFWPVVIGLLFRRFYRSHV